MKLPPVLRTHQGRVRRVGVELEFIGMELTDAVTLLKACYGGESKIISEYEVTLHESCFGTFRIEYDSKYLKQTHKQSQAEADSRVNKWLKSSVGFDNIRVGASGHAVLERGLMESFLRSVSPLEIVAPPIALTELYSLNVMVRALRRGGAKGGRNQPLRALGLHFNVEVESDCISCILPVFKAFLCLYDWLVQSEEVELLRKLSPYVQPFPLDYVRMVVDPRYNPPIDLFIDDYLDFNPTRNRPLDLLPLFMAVFPERIESRIDSSLISARPAFHYRLPNSDIDSPDWSLTMSWNRWVMVEMLANNTQYLDETCRAYFNYLGQRQSMTSTDWLRKVNDMKSVICRM